MWVLELKGGQSERSDKKNPHVDGNIIARPISNMMTGVIHHLVGGRSF